MIWTTNDDISIDLTKQLISNLNMLDEGEKLVWYFSSNGGDTHEAFAIVDIINNNKDRIELIASEFIVSSAFYIFFNTMCSRRIIQHTTGMMHCSSTSFTTMFNGKIINSDKPHMKSFVEVNNHILKWCENLGFSTLQLKDMKASKDISFMTDELEIFLNNSKLLNVNFINS